MSLGTAATEEDGALLFGSVGKMFKADEKMFDVVTGLSCCFTPRTRTRFSLTDGADYPVYHTAFDSYDWMIHNADPLFHRHKLKEQAYNNV
ncbi:LOW QUALITY PROTEIN: hypothetical protein HID58_071394 [Brassica napus]|uniref:Uncharacterized protein n=1 Tax=Brassica napus TaxID=3708 RepID=A0ABQ7Z1G8_BRANA|nr:LOW QUALITY PROTEIN: hypothetical protein HID58_071394 [Brassica napus]